MQGARVHDGSAESEDILRSYFDQIKRTPLLSFEEELELSKRIQRGDEEAKRGLIEANLRLVVKIAKSFLTPDTQLVDLIQEGNLGLIKAAGRYDHARQVRFSTYASWWIKQSILRALANKRRAIRIPHRKEELLKRIQRAYTVLTQSYMRQPSFEEVGLEVGVSADEVSAAMSMSSVVASLDSETQAENGTLVDLLEDYTYSPDRQLMQDCVREKTMDFLETLMEKERKILMYRFEFFGGKKYTLKKISEELGISPETVRQIEIRALKKLRGQAEELREYMNV